MQKETILAKIRVSMQFSKKTNRWLAKLADKDIWFAKKEGGVFFSEFRSHWEKTLIEACQPVVDEYFLEIGMPIERLPHIKVYESYQGTWIMEAALIMFATIGTTYTILKGLSELPQIADRLNELKGRLKKEFASIANKKVKGLLSSSVKQEGLPDPPDETISTDFQIDARPILSLTPSLMKSHKIHLNAAVSRDAFTLENLGEDTLRNMNIGLFKGHTQRNQWNFADSYMGNIDILSPHQTITRSIAAFRNMAGHPLDLDDDLQLHVDCWVQDSRGIYLFMFFLEKE